MRICIAVGVLLAAVTSARAADSPSGATTGLGRLPAEMWERVLSVEPESIDLTPTGSPQAPATLSLKEAIGLAFRHNAAFRQTQQALVNARQGLWVADQRLFYSATAETRQERPVDGETDADHSASASVRWERFGGDSVQFGVGTGAQDVFGDLLTQRPALNVTYERPLLRGAGLASATWQRVRRTRAALAGERLSFYDARQALALTIIDDYFSVLLAGGEIEIAQRTVERAKRFYDINYMKFSGEGLQQPGEEWVSQVAEIDVDQARLSWERAKQSVIRQQQAYQDAMDRLLLDMGFLAGSTPQLTTPIAYSPQDYAEPALVRTALTNSTDLARFNLDLEDADAARTIAYSSARPDLIASVGVNDAGQTLGGQTYSTGWFGGLRVEVPLRDRALAEDKQRVDRDTAVLEQRITAARDSVAQQVQRLVRAADSVKASIAIGEEALALARKNREQAQGMYDEGLSDYLRVLDADDRLVEAERSLLQQQVQYFLTAVRIRQALGEDITQDLPG